MLKSFFKMFLGGFALLLLLQTGSAQAREQLVLYGDDGAEIIVSLNEIMAFPATGIVTTTPWTDGERRFTGVSFDTLLDRYGISAPNIQISALNDYNVTVPASVLRQDGAILAYHLDGEVMSVRDKGPFWVIFPYDSDPRFQTDTYWSYSVWQVKSVHGQQ
ncbi:molybdopterin-dependent oxidoreductase [Thalassospira sp.]|uniref:molybdopterin-dependent oxidoreductase n=1 Tax=Thalassospira sp. TaxID=1912094 RepID=UPI002736734E|nr:molybdopterin-dependent oxidoreductase [Thalassospira sp.]MDP2699158.1 hypothetical protein [Thalassospira sp.]